MGRPLRQLITILNATVNARSAPLSSPSGLTDHFGTIVNFDVLVGCLLSDVPEPMAGELCVYPGSHHALASYFANHVDELVSLRSG